MTVIWKYLVDRSVDTSFHANESVIHDEMRRYHGTLYLRPSDIEGPIRIGERARIGETVNERSNSVLELRRHTKRKEQRRGTQM